MWIGKRCAQGKTMGAERVEKDVVFATATTGAAASKRLFTVTGCVALTVVALCTTDLVAAVGGATLEVGLTGATAVLIAQTTAENIDADEVWSAAAPATKYAAITDLIPVWYIVNTGIHVLYTVATQAVATGAIKFICFWEPISEDGYVEAAGVNAAA